MSTPAIVLVIAYLWLSLFILSLNAAACSFWLWVMGKYRCCSKGLMTSTVFLSADLPCSFAMKSLSSCLVVMFSHMSFLCVI